MENTPTYLKIEGTVVTGIKNGRTIKNIVIPEGVTEIGDFAFFECIELASITIPESVMKIGQLSFGKCEYIKTVHYGGTLAQWCAMKNNHEFMDIAEHLFLCDGMDIKALTELVIPEGVTKINYCAFRKCDALTSVVIPESVTEIEDWTFNRCENIKTVRYNGTLAQWYAMENDHRLMMNAEHVLLGDGTDIKKMTELVIPEDVTEIGKYAFGFCAALTSIVIHEGVTKISEGAFCACEKLKTVRYRGTLAQWCEMENDHRLMENAEHVLLGDGTDIRALTSLVIPESVTKIGQSALGGCKMLADLTIPENVKEIGDFALNGCFSLKRIAIPSGIMLGDLFYTDPSINIELVKYSGTLAQWCEMKNNICLMFAERVLLADGTDIKALTELVIPEGVTKIGKLAFYECTSLTSVVIPEGVTEIGNSAFEGCTSLISVAIPESVTEIGNSAFCECTALTSVVIPKSVKKIGSSAFRRCTALASVVISEGVTEISFDAFENCTALASVVISEGVKEIGFSAFRRCTALASITIPESVTKIRKDAFKDCTSLTSVSIPKSIAEIDFMAFDGCENIKTVQYGGTIEQWCAIKNNHYLIQSAEQVFLSDGTDIKTLTELVIPKGVTEIDECAFIEIASIVIPESVAKISEGAFSRCEKLKTVRYGGTLAQWCEMENDSGLMSAERVLLGDGADIKTLTEIVIPAGVTKIGNNAFMGCKKLTRITIPCGVAEIGNGAFGDCERLAGTITIPGSVKRIGDDAFSNCKLDTIYYGGTLEDWCTGNYDCSFAQSKHVILSDGTDLKALTAIEIPEGARRIESGMTSGESLTSITIPKSVKEVGKGAFLYCKNIKTVRYTGTFEQWCAMDNKSPIMEYAESVLLGDGTDIKKLTAVEIPEGITEIGSHSFWKCGDLESVVMPERVTEIGAGAFGKCGKLKNIHIAKDVTIIGENAFYECTALTSIVIPEEVIIIGLNAFGACCNLKDIRYDGTKERWGKLFGWLDCLGGKTIHCSDGDITEEYSE